MEKDFGKEVSLILPVQSMHEELNSILRKDRDRLSVIDENGHSERLQAAINRLEEDFPTGTKSKDMAEILTRQNLLSQMIYRTADDPAFDHEPHGEVLGAGDIVSEYEHSIEGDVADVVSLTRDLGATVIKVDFQNRRRES